VSRGFRWGGSRCRGSERGRQEEETEEEEEEKFIQSKRSERRGPRARPRYASVEDNGRREGKTGGGARCPTPLGARPGGHARLAALACTATGPPWHCAALPPLFSLCAALVQAVESASRRAKRRCARGLDTLCESGQSCQSRILQNVRCVPLFY